MSTQWVLESTKAPGLKFKIISLDKATNVAKLLGDTGVPFERKLSQQVLDQYGYRIVKLEVAAAAPA